MRFIAEVRGFTGADAKQRIEAVVAKTELDPVLEQPIDTLSKGFKRRVGLAQAILHDPPVLIMDEPTDGLDPNQKHAVRALIRAMAPQKAIIVSTHLLEEVEAICTRAVIIDRGRVVADGTPGELLARSRHHNAVTMALPPAQADSAKAKLKSMNAVVSVEQTDAAGRHRRTDGLPQAGRHADRRCQRPGRGGEVGREGTLCRGRTAGRRVPRRDHPRRGPRPRDAPRERRA